MSKRCPALWGSTYPILPPFALSFTSDRSVSWSECAPHFFQLTPPFSLWNVSLNICLHVFLVWPKLDISEDTNTPCISPDYILPFSILVNFWSPGQSRLCSSLSCPNFSFLLSQTDMFLFSWLIAEQVCLLPFPYTYQKTNPKAQVSAQVYQITYSKETEFSIGVDSHTCC